MTLFLIAVSFVLAMNIGANNSAASMGAAYGAGVRSLKNSLWLVAVFAVLGAVLAGGRVIDTLGSKLISPEVFHNHLSAVVVVLLVATTAVIAANWLRVPVATTHAIVCAEVAAGVFYGALNVPKFLVILAWWILTPLFALGLSFVLGYLWYFKILHLVSELRDEKKIRGTLGGLVTLAGCYVAFSAGSNNAANSVGPLVGAGYLLSGPAALLAAAGMGLGAIFFGDRVMETVGKGITELGVARAIMIQLICATIVLTASGFGIPVSLGEVVTACIIGLSCARSGFRKTAQNDHVVRIAVTWIVIPLLALILAYALLWILKICF
ncbi:MAG: anion permease [Candidatus Omnitrophica bacterium]|nr:anion permease [Candidatus Omnitrophota bacterium]